MFVSSFPGQLGMIINSGSLQTKIIAVLNPFIQWHRCDIWMIHFSVGLLLSVGQSSTLTVKIKYTCIQGVSQSEVHVYPGDAGLDGEFL